MIALNQALADKQISHHCRKVRSLAVKQKQSIRWTPCSLYENKGWRPDSPGVAHACRCQNQSEMDSPKKVFGSTRTRPIACEAVRSSVKWTVAHPELKVTKVKLASIPKANHQEILEL